jgi:hypothetical protein
MGGGMQGVQIGWGVFAFAFFQVASCGSRVFGEPIADLYRSLCIYVGMNGGTNGVRIGWKFLAERISVEADVHWSAILGLFISDWGKTDYGAFIVLARVITVIWYGERNTWYYELGNSQLM